MVEKKGGSEKSAGKKEKWSRPKMEFVKKSQSRTRYTPSTSRRGKRTSTEKGGRKH